MEKVIFVVQNYRDGCIYRYNRIYIDVFVNNLLFLFRISVRFDVFVDREFQFFNVELFLGSVGLFCFNNQKQKNVKNYFYQYLVRLVNVV